MLHPTLVKFAPRLAMCLSGAAMLLALGDPAQAQTTVEGGHSWRRTAQGWERIDAWTDVSAHEPIAPTPPRVIHPVLFAGIIAVIAIGALLLPDPKQQAARKHRLLSQLRRRSSDRPLTRSLIGERHPAAD